MICRYWSALSVAVLFLVVGSVYGQQAYNNTPTNRSGQPPYSTTPTTPPRTDPYGGTHPGYEPSGYRRPVTRPPANQPNNMGYRYNNTKPVAARPNVPRAPFTMAPAEQDYVNRVLAAWEKYSDNIKTFEADFTLRTYGSVFQNTQKNQPPAPKMGKLKYEKPDKGYFEITGEDLWICDGDSLFEYDYLKKEVVQHALPPEERGKTIQNGPLPFVFGAKAAMLKQRYWIRALPSNNRDQIWMQAFPKYARDAAEFTHVEMIISAKDIHPIGIQMHLPNGKTTQTYVFQNVNVNKKKSFMDGLFGKGPFDAKVPSGWTKVKPQQVQAGTGRAPQR